MRIGYSAMTITTKMMSGIGSESSGEITFNASDASGEFQIVARDRLAIAAAQFLSKGNRVRVMGHTTNDWKECHGECECGRDIVTRMLYISAEDIQVKKRDWQGILELQPLLM